MGSSSQLWTKAQQNAGPAAKDLEFKENLGDVLDNLDKLARQYLVLENKLFRTARSMFIAAKKVRRIGNEDKATIREAAASKEGPEKAKLLVLLNEVDRAVDNLKTSTIHDVTFRNKRQIAMIKRILRELK